jgi:predicted RNA-binding Zn-ribbon protein involved in translation (DUF1610 family)
MKPTKKAKTAKVTWKEIPAIRRESEFQCPTCKVNFRNTLDYHSKITRFKCDCGQEIIVK